MGDFKKILLIVSFVFVLLISFTIFSTVTANPLSKYKPYQVVRPTRFDDRVEVYDSIIDFTFSKRVKKPFVLITESEERDLLDAPTYKVVDYGTYREIDSIKCIRYKQMQWKMYRLDKLNEKSCE